LLLRSKILQFLVFETVLTEDVFFLVSCGTSHIWTSCCM
jgi:hypothetical protein